MKIPELMAVKSAAQKLAKAQAAVLEMAEIIDTNDLAVEELIDWLCLDLIFGGYRAG